MEGMGIYDMIMLLAVDMHWPRDVLVGILGFWSMATNGFVLLKAMVGQTLLDVAVILNLPIYGEECKILIFVN